MSHDEVIWTRRGRHTPRLCQACGAPMAADTDVCWRCQAIWSFDGTPWVEGTAPRAAAPASAPALTPVAAAPTA